MKATLILVCVVLLLWLLYDRGVLTVGSKRALYYMGRLEAASYKDCSGRIHRILRPKESGDCWYTLQCRLTKGSMRMEILDKQEQRLLVLDRYKSAGHVYLKEGEKYYLLAVFEQAEGSHRLTRQ